MTTILLVDDDIRLCVAIKELLTQHAFQVFVANESHSAEALLKEHSIDLILLDLLLPGEKDGMALCQSIRKMTMAPIIILSGVKEDVEKIISLEVGADFFLTKPFNSRVLIAHIRAMLRRSQNSAAAVEPTETEYQIYEFSGWKLNIATRTLCSIENKLVKLTASEFSLLQVLLEHPQRILSRDQLLDLTARSQSVAFDRSIDILMSRLRAKIEKNKTHAKIFTTIRNGGYLLSCKVNRKVISGAQWDMLLKQASSTEGGG
ncbi:MAG: response regulator [Gammaproteobacteria bacterium]|nr:response regulator [Gammaproteobacteria bacterium]